MSEWIYVSNKLPKHNQIVLCYSSIKNGYGVSVFVDSVKMNESLALNGYANEVVDTTKNPYYFVSQEVKQHTYNNVTHWMPLPEPPHE